MKTRPFFLLMLVTLGCGPALAARVIQYGNRAGEEADIVSAVGLGTAHAVLRARITRANAAAYCQAQEDKVTPKCLATTLSFPLEHSATANCLARTFTDFHGDHWRFVGSRENSDGLAKFRIIHAEIEEEADGSMASGYGISLGLFRALCPRQAPPESTGY